MPVLRLCPRTRSSSPELATQRALRDALRVRADRQGLRCEGRAYAHEPAPLLPVSKMQPDLLICPLCHHEYPSESFAGKKRCQSCRNKRNAWYAKNQARQSEVIRVHVAVTAAENRAFILEYLRLHPCVDCGGSDPRVLDFDHIHGQKRSGVLTMVKRGYSRDSILSEIAKCEVVCCNCHRIRTGLRAGWWWAL